jgi:hypothetical protein
MATLQQITTRAKQLRKNYPSAKWTDLIKTASLELKRNPVRVKSMIKEVAIKKFGSIAGLPDNFTFSFGDSKFYVQKQFNMYGLVDLVIYDKKTDEAIVILDGKNKETAINRLNSHIRSQQQTRSGKKWTSEDMDDMGYTKAIKKLMQELTTEVKKYNVKHKPSKKVVVKKVAVKKSAPRKSVAKKSAPKKATKQSESSSLFYDKLRQAKKPGKRTTAWGTTYYESRANRSDKGVLLGMHKDTKSHNVRISVVSGISKTMERYKNAIKEFEQYQDAIQRIKKNLPGMTAVEKVRAKLVIKNFTNVAKELKTHATQLKKHI